MSKFLSLFFIVTILSCGKNTDYVYHDNPPKVRVSNKSYSVISLAPKQVDVLWVIDNSGSMSGIQRNIVKNSRTFMEEFIKDKFVDWRMAVMSTDKSDDFYLGLNPIFDKNFAAGDPNQEDLIVQELQDAVDRLGTGGDIEELVFYNIHRALTRSSYNKFFRSNAHLAVIMVTDEPEQSEDNYGSQFQAIPFLNFVKTNMAPGRLLRFYGAFDFKDLSNCSGYSWTYKDSPFEEIISATGGIHMSACETDFGLGLAEIGRDIVSLTENPYIVLNERPDTKTLKVSFKGKEIKGGPRHEGGNWYYDEYFNKIYFYDLKFIPQGETGDIDVFFEIYDNVDRDD